MAARTFALFSLWLAASCATSTTLAPEKQAELVEDKLAELGEKRQVAGGATAPSVFFFELSKPLEDGSYSWAVQEVPMVHVVAGTLETGIVIYKVGLVADQPVIVCKTSLGSGIYDVVWENWPDGQKRAGSPAPNQLQFKR